MWQQLPRQPRATDASNSTETLLPRCLFSLFPSPLAPSSCRKDPLNTALAVESLQSQVKAESAAFVEGADLFIVVPPRESNLQAIVLVLNAEAVPNRLPPVSHRQRILVFVSQINDGRAEDRPIAMEEDSARNPDFLLIAKIFHGSIDVTIELQVANLKIGLCRADCQVDFVPAGGEVAFVDTVAVGDVDQSSETDTRATNDVGHAIVETGSRGKDASPVRQSI